jgi:osmotically inducible lipoprotein OsmB
MLVRWATQLPHYFHNGLVQFTYSKGGGKAMKRTILLALILMTLTTTLTACGYSPGDRAASGGLIGAGTGAAIAAATGGAPLVGALVGGAVGAIGGAATSPSAVNLGKPVWR